MPHLQSTGSWTSVCLLCSLLLLGQSLGCGDSLRRVHPGSGAPNLAVKVMRGDGMTGTLPRFAGEDALRAGEPATIEVRLDRPGYFAVVLYAERGESEDLSSAWAGKLVPADQPLRVVIPRRAPPGVPEKELRLFIAASSTPIPDAARTLFRLPCQSRPDDGRGDREPERKEEKKPEAKKEETRAPPQDEDKGKPREGGPRGGDKPGACAVPTGLSAPVTLCSLVIASE
jgi:hypothetical protein